MEGQCPTTNMNLLYDDDDDDKKKKKKKRKKRRRKKKNKNLKGRLTIERGIEHFNEILTSNTVIQITEKLVYQRTVLNTESQT